MVETEAAGRGSDADDNTTGSTKDATRTSNKLQPTLPRRRLTWKARLMITLDNWTIGCGETECPVLVLF